MSTAGQPNPPEHGQLLVYAAEDGKLKLDVRLEGESAAGSVIQEFLTTAADVKPYRTKHYNLDAIISVGYRGRSALASRPRAAWNTGWLVTSNSCLATPSEITSSTSLPRPKPPAKSPATPSPTILPTSAKWLTLDQAAGARWTISCSPATPATSSTSPNHASWKKPSRPMWRRFWRGEV